MKTYRAFGGKPVAALNNVTLEIPRGEIFGFLGPNGSGKTTLLKCLLNIIFPTSGDLTILDKPATDLSNRRQIGYLPEAPYFYDRFNAYELLDFYGGLYGMSTRDIRARIPVVLDEVGLSEQSAKRRLRTYSKGMLQRVGIAQAIIAEPELIILDEPSTGLDPIGRRQIKELIRTYHQRGHTLFLNTHILEDIEDLSHRVGVIYLGNLLALSTVEDLTHAPSMLELRVRQWTQDHSDAIAELIEDVTILADQRLRLTLRPGLESPLVIHALTRAGADIFSATPVTVRLEDKFLQLLAQQGGVPAYMRDSIARDLPSAAVRQTRAAEEAET